MRCAVLTRMSTAAGLVLALLVASPVPAGAEPPGTAVPGSGEAPSAASLLTLDEAVALALKGNRDLQNAALDAANAEDELRSFRTQGLPQLNVYAIGSRVLDDIDVRVPGGAFGDFPGIGPIPATDTEVTTRAGWKSFLYGTVSQPITQLRKVGLGTQIRRTNLEISRERLREQGRAVVHEVRRAYYGLLRTQSGLGASEEALAALRELDRVVEARVGQRVELPAGGLEVKARLASEEHNALLLSNGLLSGRERLNDLLGRPIGVIFRVDPVPEMSPYEIDIEAARAAALANRSDLKEVRLRRQQAEVDYRIKRWDFVPDLSLTYSYLAMPSVELLPKSFTTLGLVLSWEPFDWGRRRHALAQARRSKEQSDNLLQEAESRAAIDVGVKVRGLRETRALLEAARLAQAAARERLKVATERYRQKAALLTEVLESQERLAASNRSFDEAVLAAWTARADLERALGED